MSDKFKSVLLRFVKAFVSGGVASVLLVPSLGGLDINSLKTWLVMLGTAFITGGVMALEKALMWQDVPTQNPTQ